MTSSPSGLHGLRDCWNWSYMHLAGAAELIGNAGKNTWRQLGGPSPATSQALSPAYRSLGGKLCVVTGGNAGVGFEVAKTLYAHGATVVLACRSKQRAQEAINKIRGTAAAPNCTVGKLEFQELDLSSLKSVRSFAKRWTSRRRPPLSLLCCNAGIMRMSPVTRAETPDGHEVHLQVNHLSHWLLANHMLAAEWQRREALHATQRPTPCRIVFVTSSVHEAGHLKFDDIEGERHYNPILRYGDSKLMNVVTAAELQRRMDAYRTSLGKAAAVRDVACSAHPGILQTDMAMGFLRNTVFGASLLVAMSKVLLDTTEAGAASVLQAAVAPASVAAGRYYAGGVVTRSVRDAVRRDREAGTKLWELSRQLVAAPRDREFHGLLRLG
eukprot:jgi/Tetstr1/421310/TSEL_012282.t1